MPTYEYQCAEGHAFEQVQKMSDPPIGTCPVCGAAAERRVSGGSGLIFRGSGFYITDYGKDGKKDQRERAAKASSESKSDSGASSSASSSGGSSASSGSGSAGSSGSGAAGGGAA